MGAGRPFGRRRLLLLLLLPPLGQERRGSMPLATRGRRASGAFVGTGTKKQTGQGCMGQTPTRPDANLASLPWPILARPPATMVP